MTEDDIKQRIQPFLAALAEHRALVRAEVTRPYDPKRVAATVVPAGQQVLLVMIRITTQAMKDSNAGLLTEDEAVEIVTAMGNQAGAFVESMNLLSASADFAIANIRERMGDAAPETKQ